MLNKKINKLLIGTNNKGKLKEIRDLLPKNIQIFSCSDFKLKSQQETGKTFKANSSVYLSMGLMICESLMSVAKFLLVKI